MNAFFCVLKKTFVCVLELLHDQFDNRPGVDSFKMDPVDSPWIILVGNIGMPGMRRDDKKIAGLNAVMLFLYFQLSSSFYTVYQDVLIGAG